MGELKHGLRRYVLLGRGATACSRGSGLEDSVKLPALLSVFGERLETTPLRLGWGVSSKGSGPDFSIILCDNCTAN